jgi:hypothetical protein
LGVIVIGRYPDYLELAERLGADAFNIPMSKWSKMTRGEQWRANAEFLDKAIANGQKIVLATPPEKIPLGSTLEKELKYLASRGFLPKPEDELWEVEKSGKGSRT